MRTKLAGLALAGLLAFTMGACGHSDEPTQQVTPSQSVGPEFPGENDEAFAELIQSNTTAFALDSKDDIVELAGNVCSELNNGNVRDVLDVFERSGVSAKDAGYFIGAAVQFKCPENKSKVDDFINANGGGTI